MKEHIFFYKKISLQKHLLFQNNIHAKSVQKFLHEQSEPVPTTLSGEFKVGITERAQKNSLQNLRETF